MLLTLPLAPQLARWHTYQPVTVFTDILCSPAPPSQLGHMILTSPAPAEEARSLMIPLMFIIIKVKGL